MHVDLDLMNFLYELFLPEKTSLGQGLSKV